MALEKGEVFSGLSRKYSDFETGVSFSYCAGAKLRVAYQRSEVINTNSF